MPYLLGSIIAIVAAMVVMFSRYEADDSAFKGEIERMKTMFIMVDGFVNTYIQAGGDLKEVDFDRIEDYGILLDTAIVTPTNSDDKNGNIESIMTLPQTDVSWQIIPRLKSNGKKDNNSYKLLVDMTKNSSLMSKAVFSESFSGREFCEKLLFGDFNNLINSYNDTDKDFENNGSGSKDDGIFQCIIYK